jgi:uncharacterized protein with NAD-binding domain and iron-sulfur cluster
MNIPMASNAPFRAVIIGGGLAGMVAANELLKQKIPVLILEKAARMGGKAGANLEDRGYEEHGYHVFPSFYANTLDLMREIGAFENLAPVTKFHYLIARDKNDQDAKNGAIVEQAGNREPVPGEFPNSIVFYQPDSLRAIVKNIFSSVIPWYEFVLFVYAMIDLCSQPDRSRGFLDQLSVAGFIHSRWYKSDIIANFHQQTVLQASSIPSYDLSAMTMKHLVNNWAAALIPLFRILNGNLQEKFIAPFEQHIRDQGGEIKLNTAVTQLLTDGDRLCGLMLEFPRSATITVESLNPEDVCIFATPHEVTSCFLNDGLFRCEGRNGASLDVARLGLVNHLESAPMAAFHFYLNRKIPNLPREHVNLFESEFGVSFIDVAQTWPGLKNTTLSVIASNFRSLKGLSEEEASGNIFAELQRFIRGLEKEDIERVHSQLNIQTPLFLNNVGTWHFRPATKTRIKNLYIAGDYCRTDADLTTMESAVISGRRTAARILEDKGFNPKSAEPIPLPRPYWKTFKVLKWLFLVPAIALRVVIVLLTMLKELATGKFKISKWLDFE